MLQIQATQQWMLTFQMHGHCLYARLIKDIFKDRNPASLYIKKEQNTIKAYDLKTQTLVKEKPSHVDYPECLFIVEENEGCFYIPEETETIWGDAGYFYIPESARIYRDFQ